MTTQADLDVAAQQNALIDGIVKKITAEDIWPYKLAAWSTEEKMEPDFEDYLRYLDYVKHKQQILDGLNMPRTFIPRPYQVEGAIHFREKVRGMIYDQPGLGKTLQACMALTTPAVIACPGYLVDQWCDFIEDQYPQWRVARINNLLWRQKRQELLDGDYDVYVVNHEMFAARREPWKGEKEPKPKDPGYSFAKHELWKAQRKLHYETAKTISYHWPRAHTLVLDESHHFKNRESSQSKMVATYADQCQQVFLLTATPQYKDIRDWWHQLRIMDPRNYTRYQRWEDEYCFDNGVVVKLRTSKAEQLRREIRQYAIGRTYNEVGLWLPDLIEKIVKVNWHPDLLKHYKQLKEQFFVSTEGGYKVDVDPASVLHTLRLMTANPEKIDAVKQLVEDIPGDKPIIIFCWYRDTAELLAEEFALAPSAVRIHGGDTIQERLAKAAAGDSRVKCVTMSAASEGVDWSDASTVIFFEEDYTPGKIYQALSRVRRWSKDGETSKREGAPVIVYYVHMKGSVDEAVHEAVSTRQGDVRKILRRALK